jgi:hypothetical protein
MLFGATAPLHFGRNTVCHLEGSTSIRRFRPRWRGDNLGLGERRGRSRELPSCPRKPAPQGGLAVLPSRPGELHPESLTDPDVILSHHPAEPRQGGGTVTCDELRYLEKEGAQKPASLIDDGAD